MNLLLRLMQSAALVLFASATSTAVGQNYPTKPVRVMVGMAPGGANDTIARLISNELSQTTGQTFIVENKPGANSTIATAELARSAPDGYTLMLVISSHVTNTLLYPNLKYKLDDFSPVSVIADTPFVLVANPKFAPKNVSELIDLAKAKEGALDFGSPGMGSTQHISLELMSQLAGMKLNHVPYKGGAPAQVDVLGGVIPMIFATPTQSLPFINQGKLKALGVSSSKRLDLLPDVPTIAESGVPGYDANVWFGIIAPAHTPKDVIDRLNKEISQIVKSDKVKQDLASMGLTPIGSTPAQFQTLIESEKVKWDDVIKKSDITFD